MCDEAKLETWAKERLSRRQFGALAGAAGIAACTPTAQQPQANGTGAAATLVESGVSFATKDGTLDGFFVHPGSGAHPGVIFWPDIAGLREAKRNMARRLAGEGYAVLVVNPYYRDVAGEQFADFAEFIDQKGFQKVRPWREKLDGEAIMRDAEAITGWLDGQSAVDGERGIGTQGYCMGGPFTMWSAAAVPGRVKAAASFHGGGLVREDYDLSPHKLMNRMQASLLIAIAQNDDAKAPEEKSVLREAASAAGRPAVIEVFPADHGWCVPDSPAYDQAAAEQAWSELLKLYKGAL